ncbi:MAG: PIN domain-containing protein [Gaiellales bacterium]
MKALVDTSAIVGRERRGISLRQFDEWSVSAMTVGELALGVEMAVDPDERAIRRHTLVRVEDDFEVREVDAAVAFRYGALMGQARRGGRRPSTADTLIAATALVDGLPLITQDADFLAFEGLDVILV